MDKMEGNKNGETPFKTYQYEAEGKAEILEEEGFINSELFTFFAMSGSPIFYKTKSGDCLVVGLHWGKISGRKDKTGGVLLK